MSNNLNWPNDIFSSPKVKSSEAFMKEEHRNTIEDSAYSNGDRLFFNKSPNPLRQNVPITPVQLLQSSWSRHQHQQQQLFDQFHLPCMYLNNEVIMPQPSYMAKRINFDDDDDQIDYDHEIDPRIDQVKEEYAYHEFSNKRKHNRDQDFMLSTAKKSGDASLKGSKISRPREKGLRKLSSRAYEIVLEMKSATYKEVAGKLVEQLYQQSQLDEEGKDEQNIKRRVYDALNVLIALGILKKQGRKIVGEKRNRKNNMSPQDQCKMYQKRVMLLEKNIKAKKEKRQQLKEKYNVIKNVIERNKQQQQSERIIRFPFIGISLGDLIDKNIMFNGQRFAIKCGKKPKPFGDVDSIKFLHVPSISSKFQKMEQQR